MFHFLLAHRVYTRGGANSAIALHGIRSISRGLVHNAHRMQFACTGSQQKQSLRKFSVC